MRGARRPDLAAQRANGGAGDRYHGAVCDGVAADASAASDDSGPAGASDQAVGAKPDCSAGQA